MSTLIQRFWEKVEIIPFHSCWEWTATKNKFGYGKINGGSNKILKAHRVSWEIHNGPILNNLCVLHKCDNPGCVNPAHLFLGTKKDNSVDMIKKGRGKGHFSAGTPDPRSELGKYNTKKTHCPYGHPYSGYNLAVYQGKRSCRACINKRAERYRNENKSSGN